MYKLSEKSLSSLKEVHPELVFAAEEAIKITKQDFMVFVGVRTAKEQEKLVAREKSRKSLLLVELAGSSCRTI